MSPNLPAVPINPSAWDNELALVRFRPEADIIGHEFAGGLMEKHRTAMAFVFAALGVIGFACPAMAIASMDPICDPLKIFVGSVKAGETRTVEFRTVYGGGFIGTVGDVIFEKRCKHFDYAPGEAVCKSLMKHGNVEFADHNPMRALTCLSSAFQAKQIYQLRRIDIEVPYGTGLRGSSVRIRFDDDKAVGGQLLSITAEGY